MKENVDLIGAINELKRDKKQKIDNQEKIYQLKLETNDEIEVCYKIEKNKKEIMKLEEKLKEI